MTKRLALRYLLYTTTGMALFSCKKNKTAPDPGPQNDNKYVNDWIYESMKSDYYWTDNIPSNPDRTQAPGDFFYGLLKRPDDRFSWIVEDYKTLLASLSGVNKEAGYSVSLFLFGQSKLGAQIQYVKKNSPAEAAGLKRGDVFWGVNGKEYTYSSGADVDAFLSALEQNHTLRISKIIPGSDGKDSSTAPGNPINLTVAEFAENPVYLDSVYEINGKKIGYFMYNFFAPDKGDSSSLYDNQVDAVFGRLKARGVTSLVLDLRYNPGGDSRSTVNLASNIIKGFSADKVFFRREYNKTLTAEITKELGAGYFIQKFSAEANNIGNQLDQVVVLTSRSSASASELLINGLRPYMPVAIVGDTTYGKNVGSWSIYKTDDRRNTWGLQPIVTKSFNAEGKSDYTTGFVPDVVIKESFRMGTLGDVKEPLLYAALTRILGTPPARMAAGETTARSLLRFVGGSQQRKAYANQLIEQKPNF
ncbi:S41 family peptidase [Chitinophaga lutea]|nr:S41 family peptidase [Chitinophaga lutea]